MSLGLLYVLLGEISVQVLYPFFNWIVYLPDVNSCEFFIYFGDQTLIQGIISKYIFPYIWFPFHFADVFLAMHKPFNWMKFHLFILSFMSLAVGDISMKCCCVECLRFSWLCFPLGLLWCHELYLSLLSTLNLFLCMV